MNVRCRCEWCEGWNQGENPRELRVHPSRTEEDKWRLKNDWYLTYDRLDNERKELEDYSDKDIEDYADYILTCSGEFDSEPVHRLALAVKCLLRGKI